MAGLNSGMNACVSGLKGVSQRVNCHSQNLASAGAYAAKSRAAFLSVVNTGKSLDTFVPAGIQATNQHFITTVGSPVSSDVPTHMSLDGQGFFIVNNKADDANPGQTAFTRVGTFSENDKGEFCNHVGDFLKVFYVNPDGTPIAANTTDINSLQTATSAGLSGNPVASTSARIKGVLSATALPGDTKQATMSVYDSLGIQHNINVNYTKTANPLEWSITITSPDAATIGAPYDTAPGMLIQFDTNGNPALINGAAGAAPALSMTWTSAAAPSTIAMDFGAIGSTAGLRSVGNNKNYDFPPPTVDGRGAGKYKQTSIDKEGYMWATFDNGYTERYARIPLATFPDANKLTEQTGGSFITSPDSGVARLSFANEGTAGGIQAASLEESTIDTASVFTDLIVDQQRYTADLRGISTIEEMLKALERAFG
ncbi:MAG: flagellar hook-basal body complex protein [Candidatus Paracaedibacteraceae bacterium]|nr:flagellar hook-basal body complex protein [Candidatus Paracaedibacteraceae bacterium]